MKFSDRTRPRRGTALAASVCALALILTACGGEETAATGGSDDTTDGATDGAADGDAVYSSGDVIEMIVPASPGGGTDTLAQFLSPHLQRTIPGEPSLQINHISGGGNVIGMNEFLRREADGSSTLLSSGSGHLAYVMGEDAVQFDMRDWQAIAGFGSNAVIYADPDVIDDPADLLSLDQPLRAGEQSPTGRAITFLVAFDLLGVELDMVFGYEGSGDARLAFERGDSDIDWQSKPAYMSNVEPLVEEGIAVPLFNLGMLQGGEVVRDPQYPDMPTVVEVYEMLHGESPSGQQWEDFKALMAVGWSLQKVWWLPEDTDPAYARSLRGAVGELLADQEFRDAYEETIGEVDLLVTGDELEGDVRDMLATIDGALQERLLEFLRTTYDVEV